MSSYVVSFWFFRIFRRFQTPRNFKIDPFKAQKVAPTEKNNYRLSSKETVSELRDKNSYFIIFNFPTLQWFKGFLNGQYHYIWVIPF